MALTVENLRIALPVELVAEVGVDGVLAVLAAPPERTATSFMPTLGQLSIRVVLEGQGLSTLEAQEDLQSVDG
jgi:hypothetical protein